MSLDCIDFQAAAQNARVMFQLYIPPSNESEARFCVLDKNSMSNNKMNSFLKNNCELAIIFRVRETGRIGSSYRIEYKFLNNEKSLFTHPKTFSLYLRHLKDSEFKQLKADVRCVFPNLGKRLRSKL